MRRILTQNGIDNTNVDGGRFHNFAAGGRSGVVKGTYNECDFFTSSANSITVDSGELLLCGHRIVDNEQVTIEVSNAPATPQQYSLIAEIVISEGGEVAFEYRVQLPQSLVQENLYKTDTGKYQLEIGTFVISSGGGVTDVTKTAPLLNLDLSKFASVEYVDGLVGNINDLWSDLLDGGF